MKLNHNKKSVKISLNLFALYAVMVCGVVFAQIGRASCRERV